MARLSRTTLAFTPDLLALAHRLPHDYPFFLNSSARQTDRPQDNTRYDILLACPRERLTLRTDNVLYRDEEPLEGNDFLRALDDYHAQANVHIEDRDMPFRGGWFIYLGYELAGQIERRVPIPPTDSSLPIAQAVRIPAAIIHDHQLDQTTIIAEPQAQDCVRKIERDLAALHRDTQHGQAPATNRCNTRMQESPPAQYLQQVEAIKRYIYDGDVFQVNLSRAWRGALDASCDAAGLYRALVRTNPAPFAAFVQFAEGAVLSSSPERLLRCQGEWVETRPIAGTHPRLEDEAADRAQRQALIAHPKERAEHIMLIDLERNDLGRICKAGSVSVSELMVLESYAHVHHIVSNVRGRIRPGVTPGQVIAACFPGGTITGCPKVRCMEIIAELEQQARGPYTGSLGYLNHDGDMDLNILIRTIVVEGREVRLRAGAGIVADSEPRRELDETRAKAKGMLLALQTG